MAYVCLILSTNLSILNTSSAQVTDQFDPAGEYPVSVEEAAGELHITGDEDASDERSVPIDTGNQTGLYHLMIGEGQNAFVANGLSHSLMSAQRSSHVLQ